MRRAKNESASQYGLHPNLVNLWRGQAIDHIPEAFSAKRDREVERGGRAQIKVLPGNWPAQSRVGLAQQNLDYSTDQKRLLVEPDNGSISISRQCDLSGLSRTGYYDPRPESPENLWLMRLIYEMCTSHLFLGVERVTHSPRLEKGCPVNPKRVCRLMRLMGLVAVYPKPRLSLPGEWHKIYRYLLKNISVIRPNQVWSTDITYLRLSAGFIYLVAVIDWVSRLILSWEVSTSLESDFCISALARALDHGKP